MRFFYWNVDFNINLNITRNRRKRKHKGGYTRRVWTALETQMALDLDAEGVLHAEIGKLSTPPRTANAVSARLLKVRKAK